MIRDGSKKVAKLNEQIERALGNIKEWEKDRDTTLAKMNDGAKGMRATFQRRFESLSSSALEMRATRYYGIVPLDTDDFWDAEGELIRDVLIEAMLDVEFGSLPMVVEVEGEDEQEPQQG